MNAIKYKIVALCICLFMVSYSSQAQAKKVTPTSYTLEGNIKGIQDGMEVKLVPGATYSSETAVAETTIKDGKFTFIGKLKEPRLFYVTFGKDKGSIPVLLENSKVKLAAAATISSDDEWISFKDEVVTGSKSHDYYTKETAYKSELEKDYAAYHVGTEELGKLYSKARTEGNKKQMDSITNTVEWKTFEANEKAFFAKVESSIESVILKHKATWWGPLLMMTQFSYLTPDQKPLYEQFSEVAKKSYYGQQVDKELNPKSLIGSSIANFKLNDKDGKPLSIKEITAGKKYVLIDFWASWCAPCRKEIPNLKTAYANYSEKGFQVLSISIDKDQKLWLKALGQENMQWPNLFDDDKVSKAFNVKTIPATFLVDSKGTIISDDLRGPALDEKLKELLKS